MTVFNDTRIDDLSDEELFETMLDFLIEYQGMGELKARAFLVQMNRQEKLNYFYS